MRASSIASANRLAETCSSIPIADVERTFDCHYALGLVASPASLALLASHAMAPFTAPAADEHVSGPSAARLARQTAVDALADHARFGNDDARNVLVNVVREGDELTRAIASRAILLSFPRRDAKAALRDALPASEHWRMYEVRQ